MVAALGALMLLSTVFQVAMGDDIGRDAELVQFIVFITKMSIDFTYNISWV